MADDLTGVTALASVGVAALAVLLAPVTARLTYKWAKAAENARWRREREAEAERWDHEEGKRRALRGEEAAKEILTDVDAARVVLKTYRHDDVVAKARLEDLYHHIHQQSELLTNDDARSRIALIADNLYFHDQTLQERPDLTLWVIGGACSEAAHEILRAYLHGRALPETPRMARLQRINEAGGRYIAEMFEEEDPLAEPNASTER